MNKIEKKIYDKINKTKKCFFEKINKHDKPLIRLVKYKEKIQIISIRNEKCITLDSIGIKKTTHFQFNKFNNLDEINMFLEKYYLQNTCT